MIGGAHGIGVSVQINPSGATQESLSHPPETHSAPKSPLKHSISALFHFLRFEPGENMTLSKGPEKYFFSSLNIAVPIAISIVSDFLFKLCFSIAFVEPTIEDGCGGVATVRRHRPGR